MHTLAALTLTALLAAPGSRASASRNGTTATVNVRGTRATVSLATGGSNTRVTLQTSSQCNAKRLAGVLAREIVDGASAFRGLPSRASVRLPRSGTALRNLERGLAKILGSGRHVAGRGQGATRFPGFTVALGRLPGPGKTKTIERPRGGRGATTTVLGLPGGGAKVTRETRDRSGVSDVTEITLRGDGSGNITRSLSFGRGPTGVTMTEGSDFDGQGNESGGFAKVQTGGGVVFDGGDSVDPPKDDHSDSQDDTGGDDGSSEPTPGGGDDGSDDDNQQNGNRQSQGGKGGGTGKPAAGSVGQGGPSMTSDGTLTVPGMSFGDATTAAVINWNRLGAAVTTPDPMGGDDTTIDERHGGHGPGGPVGGCGALERTGFDPDPEFLRPNKGRWVTDPVPVLRGTQRGRNRKP